MTEILLFGAGGHAKVVLDILRRQSMYKVVGIVDSSEANSQFKGLPVYRETEFINLRVKAGLVAIGDNWVRAQVVKKILSQVPAFEFVTAIHPQASLADGVKIGAGSVVMAGAVLNSDVSVAEHCIVNTSAAIDHDGQIAEFASVGPGCVLGGGVTVNRGAVVALGAKIIHGKSVGEYSVIGAGSVVVESIPPKVVALGLPCRVIRPRTPEERYL